MNIAIMEYRSRLMVGGIERFAAEQSEAAFVVYCRTAQGIVGTFEIAVVEYRMFCPNEWAEVWSGDESAVVKMIGVGRGGG